jgi:hypothetical protein
MSPRGGRGWTPNGRPRCNAGRGASEQSAKATQESSKATQDAAVETLSLASEVVERIEAAEGRADRERGMTIARVVGAIFPWVAAAKQGEFVNTDRLGDLYIELLQALAPTREDEFPPVRELAPMVIEATINLAIGEPFDGVGFFALAEEAIGDVAPYLPQDADATGEADAER